MILDRAFFDIYDRYWKWNDKTLPLFKEGEEILPSVLEMTEVQPDE